jgi:hypothetical protein
MATWKPSKEEKQMIREFARREADCGRIKIEAGIWDSVTGHANVSCSINHYAFTDDPLNSKGEIDLWDFADWKRFTDGIELVDGKAYIDFYLYSVGPYSELLSNLEVEYADGRIQKIWGYPSVYLDRTQEA